MILLKMKDNDQFNNFHSKESPLKRGLPIVVSMQERTDKHGDIVIYLAVEAGYLEFLKKKALRDRLSFVIGNSDENPITYPDVLNHRDSITRSRCIVGIVDAPPGITSNVDENGEPLIPCDLKE